MKSDRHTEIFFASRNHKKGVEYINHFSTIKVKYKTMAIAIVAAFLAALSPIIKHAGVFAHIDELYFISAYTIVLIFALHLIRFLDIDVSHEQIRMLFKKVIAIEEAGSMPRPYKKISEHLYSKSFDPVIIDFLYYGSINVG